ncbi:hypothetical protein A33Q_4302 [Indibacter alkaliphilus LW1]|uniref:Cardiolipin synthase N-terminal domain-containing protein n=2 Tax=Indibacter TaxID=647744 RepID=S2D019_INDAL|nr:hypothetical protein A33Q_4302 [Indibacter alkaliphilus LW1]
MGLELILAVLYGILSFWAIWDLSLKRNLTKSNKMIWLALILFFHPIGPFLYFHEANKQKRKSIFQRH